MEMGLLCFGSSLRSQRHVTSRSPLLEPVRVELAALETETEPGRLSDDFVEVHLPAWEVTRERFKSSPDDSLCVRYLDSKLTLRSVDVDEQTGAGYVERLRQNAAARAVRVPMPTAEGQQNRSPVDS